MSPDRQERESHQRYLDDLATYALGALDPREAAELERHLERCTECRGRLRWLQPAVDVLPASVEQLDPPPDLRAQLLRDVRRDARRAATVRGRRGDGWRSWRALAPRPASALAALAILVGGVAAGYVLWGDDEPVRAVIPAEPSAVAPPGEVAAALEREGDSATLHVSRLPDLRRDEAYQVWIQAGSELEPSSVFSFREAGSTAVPISGRLEGADRLLVTKEPRGGSTRPTSPPLLVAPLG